MKLHDEELVIKARGLRKKEQSFDMIAHALGVSDRTVRRWCCDIPGKNRSFITAASDRELIKKSAHSVLDHIVFDTNLCAIIASVLYWAEGTKYPNSVAVSFSNSDPVMIEYFVRLLRKAFILDENKFRIHLQIHTTHNKDELFSYWSGLLNIPLDKFWKPTVTAPTRKMKRQNYMGTCTVRYHDYKVLLQLIGIFESLPSGELPEWLKGAVC